jgi:N-sulfoglucosamine sulfohydrolase
MKYNILSVALIVGTIFKPNQIFPQQQKLNILLFTADDLDKYSLGCYGSKVPDISPNINRFAKEGLRFNHAYINNSISVPCRGILATGLYGHNSGVMGFMKMKDHSPIPLLMEILKENNYYVGVMSKVSHSTPKSDFQWDYTVENIQLGNGRNPDLYYERAREFFQQCRKNNKPFYFMMNSDDPHRPFYNPNEPVKGNSVAPSRTYSPEEITEVPGFIPDLPFIREEMSYYFNSVKRLDDTFGRVMQALDESGFMENTLVIFISDNGMAFPFAKANTYYASNRTPWLVRWPGVIKPGSVDNKHFISIVDYFPTVLEAAKINPPDKFDGRSLLAIYKGKKQSAENMIFSQIDNLIQGGPVPMRSLQNSKIIYIFNSWSDGERIYANNNEGMTMEAMKIAAKTNIQIAKRIKMFRYRTIEEFYDLKKDPNCLFNLIENKSYLKKIEAMRNEMEKWMVKTNDPLLKVFQNRNSPQKMLDAFYETYPEAKKYDENKSLYSGKGTKE